MKMVRITIAAAFACLALACATTAGGVATESTAPAPETPGAESGIATVSPSTAPDAGMESAPTTAPVLDPTAASTGPSDLDVYTGTPRPDGPLPTTAPVANLTSEPIASYPATQEQASGSGTPSTMFGPVTCEGTGRVPFTYFPLDIGIISSIGPMGLMAGSHVTPVDHIYITHDSADQPGHGYVVRTPAGGFIVEIQRMPNPNRPDYRMVIAHTCTLFTTFIHTGELAPDLKAVTGELELGGYWSGAFAIEAGQIVADASTNTMDFMVHDQEVTLPGFIVPESYIGEPWKIHTLDPFDFFDEPLRSQALAFNPRTAEPRGGKIDYDIDGRLVGNWFVEGTGGYSNARPSYWETHLAMAYDYIDPSVLVISIGADTGIPEGACNVCAGAYGIKGNAPDPATVGLSDGLVKYELIGRLRPEPGAPMYNDETNSLGVFLAEMIDDRSVRIEVVPGVLPSAVTGFTSAAVVYTR